MIIVAWRFQTLVFAGFLRELESPLRRSLQLSPLELLGFSVAKTVLVPTCGPRQRAKSGRPCM
jgi:hypothetical protein